MFSLILGLSLVFPSVNPPLGLPPELIYVAPVGGDDSSPGTRERPFATLKRAVAQAEKLSGDRIIIPRAGTHYLAEPLVIANSGSLTIMPEKDETVVISGGRGLKPKWLPHHNSIMKTRVPDDFQTDQLFVNGVRQVLARYPNFNPNERIYNGYAADAISPARAKLWSNPAGGFIHAMHGSEWGGYHFIITGKNSDGSLKYEGGFQNNRPGPIHPRFRFVENIFEELDAPGEWYLDHAAHTLYFLPPPDLNLDTAVIEAPRLKHLIEVKKAKGVVLQGLTFRHALRTFMENKEPLVRSDWTTYRGGAILFENAQDCRVVDCLIDQVGGNAIFVNNFNRGITIKGCRITEAGGNGVAFVGDRAAARVPRDWNDRSQTLANLDRQIGPKTENFPADCLVDDCLIDRSGRVEKQTAPVQIELAQRITVRHCSLYDVPRAGINIGDGCWGGHLIEFCDIFDTVKETGDHGSFNSWGRDRFWNLAGLDLNDDKTWATESLLTRLDAVEPTTIRNNRWRCDHGWDIDLDDGSTAYHLYNNLCLRGGIKNREGFFRIVENNIIINNGFHPHVWYKHSEDIVRKNIFTTDHYLPAGGMPSTPWGREMDFNLVHSPGITTARPATKLAEQSQRDAQSIIADAQFIDPEHGDFRVKDGSPALALGFVNFPMDQFGVQKPALKAIARTPVIPTIENTSMPRAKAKTSTHVWQGLKLKELEGDEYSAFGVAKDAGGVQVLSGQFSGIQPRDLVQSLNGRPIKTFADVHNETNRAAGKPLVIGLIRNQEQKRVSISEYVYYIVKNNGAPSAPRRIFRSISASPDTNNEPVDTLNDGKLAENYGPVFGNGTTAGTYKIDLGGSTKIQRVNTWSHNQNRERGSQRFVLYGSNSPTDPGDTHAKYELIAEVETMGGRRAKFTFTSISSSKNAPLGTFRYLLWVVEPVTSSQENTAYQELEVEVSP